MIAYSNIRSNLSYNTFEVAITRPNLNEIRASLFLVKGGNRHYKRSFLKAGASIASAGKQASASEALETLYFELQNQALFLD